jgi:flagellar capping protein FliD
MANNLTIYIENVIPGRKENYTNLITTIDKRVEVLEDRLSKLEADYRRKFFELEKTIGSLQRSGDSLTQTLNKWGNNR